MKGLIAEIDGRNMIVITEKGDFVKVKRNIKYGIGDEIQLRSGSRNQLFKAFSAVAASIMICVMLGSGVYAYYTPYSYVSVDINPSLGLSLNRFEKVIDVQPLNDDAKKIISNAKPIKNKNIDQALSSIMQSAVENGYLKPNQENGVMVVVSAKEKKEETKLAQEVKAVSKKELEKVSRQYNLMLEKTSVDQYKAAIEHKTSPGKAVLAQKLKSQNQPVPDAKDLTVAQALKLLEEKKEAERTADKAAKEEFKQKHKTRRGTESANAGNGKDNVTSSKNKGSDNDNDKDKSKSNATMKSNEGGTKGNSAYRNKKQSNGSEKAKDIRNKKKEESIDGKNPNVSTDKGSGSEEQDASGVRNAGEKQNKDKDKDKNKGTDKNEGSKGGKRK